MGAYGYVQSERRSDALYVHSPILQSALDAYIRRLSFTPQGDLGDPSLLSRTQTRLTHAMVLSLLGVSQPLSFNAPFPSFFSQAVETDESPQFRPHRAAILMWHVQSVFQPPSYIEEISHVLPFTELDVPQRILISLTDAIFWAWAQWNDERICGIESVLIWV